MDQKIIGLENSYKIEINKSIVVTDDESINSYYLGNRIAQEQHHAMHALTFLHFMIVRTMRGERLKRRLLARVIHHLRDLREFLNDGPLNVLVNELLRSLGYEYDYSLFILARVFHCWIRGMVEDFEGIRSAGFFFRISTIIIRLSENSNRPMLSMFPWFIKNQDKVLGFAEHYGKKDIFKSLLPITGIVNQRSQKGMNDYDNP